MFLTEVKKNLSVTPVTLAHSYSKSSLSGASKQILEAMKTSLLVEKLSFQNNFGNNGDISRATLPLFCPVLICSYAGAIQDLRKLGVS